MRTLAVALLGLSLCLARPAAALAGEGFLKVPLWAESQGELLTELNGKDLSAWIDGQPAAVKSVRGPGQGLILLLVMDLVGDLNRIDAARAALKGVIENLGPRQFAAVLQAQDGLTVVEEPTRNKTKLIEAIQSVRVSGYPGLLGAVEPAAKLADRMLQNSDVRVAVLFLTDGRIEQYRGDYTNPVVNPSDRSDLSRRFGNQLIQEEINLLTAALASSWAPLFFLHLEERTGSQDIAYQAGIAKFAQATGGQALFCNATAEIATRLRQLTGRIRAHHSVKIAAPEGFHRRGQLRLESSRASRLDYRAPVGLAPASPAGQ